MPDYRDRLREQLAAEGVIPSQHADAIEEIAEHLDDLHRAAGRGGQSAEEADAIVEAELARIGPLAAAVAGRARNSVARTGRDPGAGLVADFRHALRVVRTERGFAAIVVLTLAIGIGACTTVFSFINALLLGSLPYPEPERLVLLWEAEAADTSRRFIVAWPVYEDWQRETRSFSSMGIWEYRTFNVASAQEPEQVRGIRSSASLFTVLGVPPALGRVFTPEEDERQERVAVISDGVWRAHLGGTPAALGRQIRLNGESYQIVGIMPPGFQFPQQGTGVWVPFHIQEQDRERDSHSFQVAARLAPGATVDTARAEVEQVGRALQQRYPENEREASTITRMADHNLGPVRTMLTALMGAVGFVLLIACVNVANLQLGRALRRRREFAVRFSLGATLGRLARQLFAESLILSAAGAIGGLLLTWVALKSADLVVTPGFRTLPFRGEVALTIDTTVLLFCAGVAVIAAALFGFAPLIGLTGREPNTVLREGDRASTGGAGAARRALVAFEVALAIVILCGAGLLIKSLAGLIRVNPGLDPREVLTLQVSLPQEDIYGPPARESFCAELSEAGAGRPGIRSIGAISHLPLSGANAGRRVTIEGRAEPSRDDRASADYRLACPGYFATLGIPIIEGRDFTHRDVTRGMPVVVINHTMAEEYWPGESPLGKRVKIGGPEPDNENPWMTVVGVIGNVRHFGLDSQPTRELFRPYSQASWPTMRVVAKTIGDPGGWQSTMRDVVRRVDPALPVAQVQSMDTVIDNSLDWRETPMKLLTGFSLIGLLLAAIGVYGVLAYYVSQRTREIGVRAALGANRLRLGALVVRQSIGPIIAGAVLGVAGSLASGRLLQELLYQVEPGDPQVIAVIVGLLAGVALLASWLPARRAASIDPIVALRDE
ncbi:MAG TPA: ABC transporter permease [Vicinamibacterales bacterium]|nr:ABC transporter permease [Vicinamibacterales bacterium]